MGTATVQVAYNWLRGTRDQGKRTHIDRLTIDSRKMTGFRNIISHMSNVRRASALPLRWLVLLPVCAFTACVLARAIMLVPTAITSLERTALAG